MEKPDFTIIGAGPAGLAAALESIKHKYKPMVLESNSQVGGLSKTMQHNGYYFDCGGHRFFTKNDEVQNLWRSTLGEEFLQKKRMSRIYYNEKYFHYPLQMNEAMFGLSFAQSVSIITGFLKARLFPYPKEKTFEDWVSNRFGRPLYEIFFKSYTEKIWGIPCTELSADWASQRIKTLDFTRAALNALGLEKGEDLPTLAENFEYPRLGPGQMYDAWAERIQKHGGSVKFHHQVQGIHHEENKIVAIDVKTEDGFHEIPVRNLVSSMPIDLLVKGVKPEPPPEVLRAVEKLRYRSLIVANLILDQDFISPDNWIYIHSPLVGTGRIQLYKNWSRDMVPEENRSSVGMEYFTADDEPFWKLDSKKIIEMAGRDLEKLGLSKTKNIVDGNVIRADRAYPIYFTDYAKPLELIKEYLGQFKNLACIGRYGQFRYNNMDHSVLTGLYAIRKFMEKPFDPWNVNLEQDYLEQ